MPDSAPVQPLPALSSSRAAVGYRLLVVTVLGFASGLPLALTGQAMQAWLSVEGIDMATIGFLSLVGLPYTFKFLLAHGEAARGPCHRRGGPAHSHHGRWLHC